MWCMGIFLSVLVPVVIAVFAMQMERFEDYCTSSVAAPATDAG